MELLESLNWRYATKKFDSSKKVSTENLEKIKEAIRLSASSYGLQLYKVLIIEDPIIREKLKPASWGQTQITDASQVIVFCNYTKVGKEEINEYLQVKADKQEKKVEEFSGYSDFILNSLSSRSDEEINHWTAKQTYIALGNLLAACGELKVDACPMEGFESDKYNEILNLGEKNLSAALVATIGYRSDEDATQNDAKIRKSADQLFISI